MGKMETDNKMLYGVGSSVLNRLNLGGAGQGLQKPEGAGNVAQSQNFGRGTDRSNYGTDKSMDNIKFGFQSKFGAQLGLGGQTKGGMSQLSVPNSTTSSAGAAASAVAQPSPALSNRQNLDNSMRQSNLLDTPSSKGGNIDDEEWGTAMGDALSPYMWNED